MVKIRRKAFRRVVIGVVLLTLIMMVVGWTSEGRSEDDGDEGRALPPLVCSGGKPNGICDKEEQTKGACPEDCGGGGSDDGGGGSGGSASCDNDNVCEPDNGEATFNCGDCPSVCGDAICAAEEVDTCLDDCSVDVTCGDGLCSAFENAELCAADCTGEEDEPVQPANQPPLLSTITPTPGEDDPGVTGAGELTPQIIETPDDVAPAITGDDDQEDVSRPDKSGESGQDFDAATPKLSPGENRGVLILIGLLAVGLIIIVCAFLIMTVGGGFMRMKYAGLLRPPDPGSQMGGMGNDLTPSGDPTTNPQQQGGMGDDVTPPSSDGLMLADPRPSPIVGDILSGDAPGGDMPPGGMDGYDGIDGES